MSKELIAHPFNPIVFKDSKILILGSFPSIKSFENGFYYSHPQNQFWKIMSTATKYPINNKDQKIWLLKEKKIALWDMVKSCSRDNSLDSSIENEDVNDIAQFLENYPEITQIAFTGKKSQAIFEYHFGHLQISRCYLPSPSSTYAKMSLEQKIEKYKELLKL